MCFALRFLANLSNNLSYILHRKFSICFALRFLASLSYNLSYIIGNLYVLHQCFRLS